MVEMPGQAQLLQSPQTQSTGHGDTSQSLLALNTEPQGRPPLTLGLELFKIEYFRMKETWHFLDVGNKIFFWGQNKKYFWMLETWNSFPEDLSISLVPDCRPLPHVAEHCDQDQGLHWQSRDVWHDEHGEYELQTGLEQGWARGG